MDEGDIRLYSSNISNIIDISSYTSTNIVVFCSDDGEEVGKLNWSTGELKFSGNADESAKLFFNFLKNYINEYIRLKYNNSLPT